MTERSRDIERTEERHLEDATLECLLRRHRPNAPPPRPEFQRALGQRFESEAKRRQRPVGERRWPFSLSWPVPGLATPAVVAAVLALFVTGIWWAQVSRLPPSITRAELIDRNARAWAETDALAGSFVTGDGWYFEEWIRHDTEGLMYKRFSRPPATTVKHPQWNVSDGQTEWVVDADTGAIRATRPATRAMSEDAPPQERLQCAALELPPGLEEGSAPLPTLLDDQPTYRLEGQTADGQPAWFWIDARDHLVRRIDRPNGITVWERQELDLDRNLRVDFFRPEVLEHL